MVLLQELVSMTLFFLSIQIIYSETQAKKSKKVKVINKLPSYFPVCYRNDPALSKCLINATKQVRPYLVRGVPELKIPSLEPFTIPEIRLELGTRSLNFTTVLKNIVTHGLTGYEFTRFDFDVPNLQIFCEFQMSAWHIEGDYSIAGRIFVRPIEGDGKFTASFDSARGRFYQKYKETTVADGKIHITPVFTNGTSELIGPKAHLDGLINGTKELNAAINRAIEENIDELLVDFQPVLEEAIIKVTEDILFKTITENIAWDDLFPIKK